MDQESWSGNVPVIGTVDTSEDPIESFRRSLHTVLGKRLAKGQTVSRQDAEILYALAQNKRTEQAGRYLADDD